MSEQTTDKPRHPLYGCLAWLFCAVVGLSILALMLYLFVIWMVTSGRTKVG